MDEGKNSDAPVEVSWPEHGNSMRNMLLLMPHLAVNDQHQIDYDAADPDVLVQLADNAEVALSTIHRTIAGVGRLLADKHEPENSSISSDTAEAIGLLLAELGEFATVVQDLYTACRSYTADYEPQTRDSVVQSAKPY